MHLLVVNPNATAEMTDRIAAEARFHLPDDVELSYVTNLSGPPSIEGAQDGEVALQGTLALLRDRTFDAAIIACFDDTGLAEICAEGRNDVVGLGHAAMLAADRTDKPFAILTTSLASVPVLQANVTNYRLDRNLRTIRASEIAVLDLESDREASRYRLTEAGRRLIADVPEIEVIVLGCAGMGGLAEHLSTRLGVQVIDPISAAARLAVSRMIRA